MIYFVVRQTTDWGNEAVVRGQIPDGFRSAVGLWDATFLTPYHVFRQDLKRIAGLSLSRVPGAVVAPRAEVPAGAIVVPTDDDDWFAPGLAAALDAAADGGRSGYFWPSAFLEVPISLGHRLGLIRRALFPRTPPKWLCTTNNYAVAMSPALAPLIDSHIEASRWFVAHPGGVKRLGGRLSVMNRTLASRTSFRSVRTQKDLLRKLRRYRALYREPLPPDLAWCEPYVAMMRELMDALRCRTRAGA
jgi:hypothetical protein